MNQISIIFPNQLFSRKLTFEVKLVKFDDGRFIFFGNDKFQKSINHKNKLIFHKASMLAYKKYLQNSGFKVIHIENKNNLSTVEYLSN